MSIEVQDTVTLSRKAYEELILFKQEAAYLKEELAQLKRLIFGKKNERFIPSDDSQSSLFEGEVVEAESESEQQTITYTKEKQSGKKKPTRLALPAHLPRKEEVIEPDGKQEDATKIGESVTEILEYTPGKVYVKRYVRPKYVQPHPDPAKDQQVVVAPLPSLPIPSGNAGPGLLAHLMISKYVDHLPFYRQVQMFKRRVLSYQNPLLAGGLRRFASCSSLFTMRYTNRS